MTERPLAAIAIRQVEKRTGASRNALEQTAALRELGYRVVILAERGAVDIVQAAGAELVRLRRWPFKGSFRRFWFNRRVQAWCRRHRPAMLVSHGDVVTDDVVYMHNCVHLASQRIHGRELPAGHEVAAIHDHVLGGGRYRRVAVNSRLMAEDFQTRYGIPAERIEISYPGYDPGQFSPSTARQRRDEVRRSLGIDPGRLLVGLVTSGNFVKRNVRGFIDMAALLEGRAPGRYRFLVVGKDDMSSLKRYAREQGVESAFIWRSTVPEVEELYGALDLFVLPAHIEEFGRVVLEAMACATPVLVSCHVGSAELLREGFERLIMTEQGAEAWAERIAELLDAPDLQQTLGTRLAERATGYSHQRQYEKLRASFEALTTPGDDT
ncbi:glycosyltransferase family 4 protein [Kushneria sinocarnis]|nr:glycosyltransferase family 4 protein [Kushneria sinocarnis]